MSRVRVSSSAPLPPRWLSKARQRLSRNHLGPAAGFETVARATSSTTVSEQPPQPPPPVVEEGALAPVSKPPRPSRWFRDGCQSNLLNHRLGTISSTTG